MIIRAGALIGIRDRKDLLLAVVMEASETRLRFLTEKGREDRLPAEKVLLSLGRSLAIGTPHDGLVASLAQVRSRVDALRDEIILEDLWQLLRDDPQSHLLEALTRIYFGEGAAGEHRAAMLSVLLLDSMYFKQKGEEYVPRPPEQVEEILLQRRTEERRAIERAQTVEWLRALDGTSTPPPPPPGAGRFLQLVEGYAQNPEAFESLPELAGLLRDLGLGGPDRWIAFDLLVKAGIWSEDENLILRQYHVPEEFPAVVLRRAEELLALRAPPPATDEEDLTRLSAITIDDARTLDIDDALSLEDDGGRMRVGIHIADVAAWVGTNDPLDEEASRRGVTIYLPERKIQMFPEGVSHGSFSLVAGEAHPALSILVELDGAFEIRGFRLVPSRIAVGRRATYQEVDAQLEAGDGPDLTRLLALAQHLRRRRIEAGALIFSVPEVRIRVDESGTIEVEKLPVDTPAHVLVSEMMVLANGLVAGWLRDGGVPAVYRVQAAPDEPIEVKEYDPVVFSRLRRLLKRPETSLAPAKHFGLGLAAYVQITSPIRRYLDLALQRQVKAALRGGPPAHTPEELAAIAQGAERASDVAGLVQRHAHRYWLLKFLRSRMETVLPAIVVDRREDASIALLTDYLLEVPLHDRPEVRHDVGEHIVVRMTHVDPRRGFIRIEEVRAT